MFYFTLIAVFFIVVLYSQDIMLINYPNFFSTGLLLQTVVNQCGYCILNSFAFAFQVAKKVNKEPRPILPGSPDKKATDISHLVKRKRKSLEGDEASGNLPKKPALNL